MHSLKLRERRGLVAQALRDRPSGHIRRDHESAVAASLLDNVEALDIAAQFHMRLIHGADNYKGLGGTRHYATPAK